MVRRQLVRRTVAWLLHFDSIRRLMTGDRHIGRGCKQRALVKSDLHNPYQVSEYGRGLAIQMFEQHLDSSRELLKLIPSLSGIRLVCHCKQHEDCHADALTKKFRKYFPDSFDRSSLVQRPPTASELDLLEKYREEPASDDGSTADEDSLPKGAGWQGTGRPMTVGLAIRLENTAMARRLPRQAGGPSQPVCTSSPRVGKLLLRVSRSSVNEGAQQCCSWTWLWDG